MLNFFTGAGWAADTQSSSSTVSTSSTTTLITQASNNAAIGEAVLLEMDDGSYRPVLVADISTNDLVPSMALPSAPSSGNVIELMQTFTPKTSTTHQVPADKTIQFKWNSLAQYNDALADMAAVFSGCATAELGELEIGPVGSTPTLSWGFHVGKISIEEIDIVDDNFDDDDSFAVVNDNLEFAFAGASSSGGISRSVHHVNSIKVNFGLAASRVGGHGGGSFAGLQGYMANPVPPTITIDAYFEADSNFEKDFITQLEGSNASKYMHIVQPSSTLIAPAWGLWLPNCHLKADSEPTVDFKGGGDGIVRIVATFEADIAGYNSEDSISNLGAQPIYFAISDYTTA